MKKIFGNKKIKYSFAIVLTVGVITMPIIFSRRTYATSETNINNELQKNVNPLDIEKILEDNISNNIREEISVEEIDLEYNTEYKNNSELPKGTMQIVQEGQDGKQKVIAIKKYENDTLISESVITDTIEKAAISKIVEIGTGKSSKLSKVKVGDTCYVTAKNLSVRLEPNKDSEKICTLNKNTEVKILEILDDWYYIYSKEREGYVDKNGITNKNPNSDAQDGQASEMSKSELTKNLSFDMDLNIPSNLSLEQFKKIFENDSNDINNVFYENAEYFYYAEKQYKINGVFLAAVAIHESGWGTSTISKNKKNLFAYGAVDSNPYGGAYQFSTYNEGIDLVARAFVKYYLNEAGTEIFDGNIANGKFYNGSNLTAVNKVYASDKNWANGVYKWMKYLYNKI